MPAMRCSKPAVTHVSRDVPVAVPEATAAEVRAALSTHSYESVADIVGSGPLATVVQNLLSLDVYFVVSAVAG
jgi:hypothetical protein